VCIKPVIARVYALHESPPRPDCAAQI
jgi:hypothetical protein